MRLKIGAYIVFLAILLASCKQDAQLPSVHSNLPPDHFPAISYPSDNAPTQARFKLGKKLFYDVVMSRDSSISCASCHKPEWAFSDQVALSPGVENRPGVRNAPSLANVAYLPYFTREGGVPTLEMQILVPIQEHNEFDFNILLIGERLQRDSSYIRMSQEAYGRDPDFFVITRALANFERNLISGHSAYDDYLSERSQALAPDELAGMNLFFSERTNCSVCHSGFNFTNNSFQNNGLYEVYSDIGRKRLTGEESDLALFKVPSLRNVGLTAPYMHDGSLENLEDVINHYNNGGENHPHKSNLIRPLGLSNKEKRELVAFLHALSDPVFISDPTLRP
ncbi:MAG: cytochrome-c peroxidase [Flavobacteriales bacterium]|nr:cytochrome-c peroxidase [Flavobacteriales bacterium]